MGVVKPFNQYMGEEMNNQYGQNYSQNLNPEVIDAQA